MKIYIYCRISKSNGKIGSGANINVQIDECLDFCKKQKWAKKCIDNDINIIEQEKTGRKGSNIATLDKILDRMAEGDIFIIHSVDRLCRDMLEGVKFLNKLNKKGCRIISVTEYISYDKSDIYGRFKFRDILNHAELESDRSSSRIILSLGAKKKKVKNISSTLFQCRKRKRDDTICDTFDVTEIVQNKKKRRNAGYNTSMKKVKNNIISDVLDRYQADD